MNRSKSKDEDQQNHDDAGWRLMIGGVLILDDPHRACVRVDRGMSILSREGQEMGKVAAVHINESLVVETVLLSRLPAKMEYLIIPAGRVVAVRDEQIILDLTAAEIDGLQRWSGS